MKISIVIPIYKDPNFMRCIKSLWVSQYYTNYKIEIIPIRDYFKDGPAVIRNQGAKQATGDILFFMDSDATVYHNTLDKIAEVMKDPKVDGVTIIWDNKPLEQNFFSKFKAIETNYLMKYCFTRVCGSNGTAIRKKVFEAVGGFDESFKDASAEDFEFGLRVLSKYNIVYDRTILMQHSFNSITKYFKRAFDRAKVLVNAPKIETTYNSKILKWMYLSVLCPPLFFMLNTKLYKKFYKAYGLWFAIRATLFHYYYMLMVTISGGLGYGYATLFNLLRHR